MPSPNRRIRTAAGLICLSILCLSGFAAAAKNPKLQGMTGGDPALAKMDSALLRMRQEITSGTAAADAVRRHGSHAARDGKLQCIIGATAISPDLLAAISAAGLETVNTHSSAGLHQITVRCDDPRKLDSIARRPDVRGIALDPAAVTHPAASTGTIQSPVRTAGPPDGAASPVTGSTLGGGASR